jgi:hypothetical protein
MVAARLANIKNGENRFTMQQKVGGPRGPSTISNELATKMLKIGTGSVKRELWCPFPYGRRLRILNNNFVSDSFAARRNSADGDGSGGSFAFAAGLPSASAFASKRRIASGRDGVPWAAT